MQCYIVCQQSLQLYSTCIVYASKLSSTVHVCICACTVFLLEIDGSTYDISSWKYMHSVGAVLVIEMFGSVSTCSAVTMKTAAVVMNVLGRVTSSPVAGEVTDQMWRCVYHCACVCGGESVHTVTYPPHHGYITMTEPKM